MELGTVRLTSSPLGPGRARLAGQVAYDDRPGQPEEYWFEFPAEYANLLTESGNPWLAALLPLAATLGEPLRLSRPIDPSLSANAARLMEIWRGWYPELRVIRIDADSRTAQPDPGARKAAALFSGGVDSFFTVLRNAEATDRSRCPPIDWLLCVFGFDLPLAVPEQFSRLRARLEPAAAELGKEFIAVTTNVRETRSQWANWGRLAHGCFLASVALMLERKVGTAYIAATTTLASVVPWGSHPDTDPLLSTSATRVIHDGADVGRSEKTDFISRSPVARRALHVCYRSVTADNCGICRKCLLTMLTLELGGTLSQFAAFPRRLDPTRVRRIFVDSPITEVIFRDLEVRARRDGRRDIAGALRQSRNRSRRVRRVLRPLRWLETKPGVWRAARRLRLSLLARMVR